MKAVILLLFVFFAFAGAVSAQTYYGSTDLKEFRDGRDKEFRDKAESPLKEEDLAAFKGLNYFPVDKNFRVTASLSRTPSEKWVQMPTSAGVDIKYHKFGVLKFKIRDEEFELSVYKVDPAITADSPEYAHLLFIPFKDLTNRKETYGGGRYIDIRTPKGDSVILDFNLAYNPNCAYGRQWSCPIPPSENALKIAVTAGEKRFAYSGAKH